MDIKEAIRSAFKDLILPEIEAIKNENHEIKVRIELTNKRLDDINLHLADQSRRIDETNKRIDETNKRIDETNKRIDSLRDELVGMITETNKRIDETNRRMDRLYEVIVRREEHEGLKERLTRLEGTVEGLRARFAA
jgi:uncharacterized coiled-coil DUF342 family protein